MQDLAHAEHHRKSHRSRCGCADELGDDKRGDGGHPRIEPRNGDEGMNHRRNEIDGRSKTGGKEDERFDFLRGQSRVGSPAAAQG